MKSRCATDSVAYFFLYTVPDFGVVWTMLVAV